ncbi:MAG: SRPBCC family protein [Planctomycetales bacterium]
MAGFKRSIIINKAIEEVFDCATNLDNASKFLPGVSKTEMLTEGGLKPGAKFKETRKGRSAVIEVVEHKRPEVHAASASLMGMRATYWFRFHADPAGTRVDMEADVQGKFIWWPFLGMMSRMMEKEDGAYLERLKAAMLATPVVETPSA